MAAATKRSVSCYPCATFNSGLSTTFLLELATAPFSKEDAQLVPEAGSCIECPKRTGHNTCSSPTWERPIRTHARTRNATRRNWKAMFARASQRNQSCTNQHGLWQAARKAAQPFRETSMSKSGRRSPRTKEEATRPEFKTCKYTTEAIVSEGSEKGELRKVCTQADCPVHHAKKQSAVRDPKGNAEEQKRRREEALAQATGLRTLAAVVAAVPVRLMKRDLLFVVERLRHCWTNAAWRLWPVNVASEGERQRLYRKAVYRLFCGVPRKER